MNLKKSAFANVAKCRQSYEIVTSLFDAALSTFAAVGLSECTTHQEKQYDI